MMSEPSDNDLQVGDRVRVVGIDHNHPFAPPDGIEGVVEEKMDDGRYVVVFDDSGDYAPGGELTREHLQRLDPTGL